MDIFIYQTWASAVLWRHSGPKRVLAATLAKNGLGGIHEKYEEETKEDGHEDSINAVQDTTRGTGQQELTRGMPLLTCRGTLKFQGI